MKDIRSLTEAKVTAEKKMTSREEVFTQRETDFAQYHVDCLIRLNDVEVFRVGANTVSLGTRVLVQSAVAGASHKSSAIQKPRNYVQTHDQERQRSVSLDD